MKKPITGITMGDPAGNGPELSVKLLMIPEVYESCDPLIVGDAAALREACKVVAGADTFTVHPIADVSEALFTFGTIDVLEVPGLDLAKRRFRKDKKKYLEQFSAEEVEAQYLESQKMTGECAFRYIVKVIELAKEGKVDATVTNALNKDYINLAGHHYSGHTEIYADYTNTRSYAMLLAYGDLRVIHNSTHVSLREACDRVKKERVLEVIRLANEGCKAFGIETPKIGVAGLNPHCGEGGLFGREEIEEIQPAIDAAIAEGICIPDKAPSPADTIFSKALGGWYDIVVVMYHDQGHIPLKVEGFRYNKEEKHWDAVEGINMTLGLPIIRVSVDHGTGEGHAGDGGANVLSLKNALDYANLMARSKMQAAE